MLAGADTGRRCEVGGRLIAVRLLELTAGVVRVSGDRVCCGQESAGRMVILTSPGRDDYCVAAAAERVQWKHFTAMRIFSGAALDRCCYSCCTTSILFTDARLTRLPQCGNTDLLPHG